MKQYLDILCNDDSDSDAIDNSLAALQTMIRDGLDYRDVVERCRDSLQPPSGRALCLEALAGSRCRLCVNDVVKIVHLFLASDESDLEFAAIASAGDLPKHLRRQVEPAIRPFGQQDNYVGRAARTHCGEFKDDDHG